MAGGDLGGVGLTDGTTTEEVPEPVGLLGRLRYNLATESPRTVLRKLWQFALDTPRRWIAVTLFTRHSLMSVLLTMRWRPGLEATHGAGIDVLEQGWDTLIVLDSYRADTFEHVSRFEGGYRRVTSQGSWSLEFIVRNFGSAASLDDVVVVTANPYYLRAPRRTNYAAFHAVQFVTGEHEEVTAAAIDAHERYPHKRVIVHYMGPHTPHTGTTRDAVAERIGAGDWSMFELCEEGVITVDQLRRSYEESVAAVESAVVPLLSVIDGRVVISADHGENLGERRGRHQLFGHDNETPECRIVPWLTIDRGPRRTISGDGDSTTAPIDEAAVAAQLEALGYH